MILMTFMTFCYTCRPFWDIIVITGGDEEQAESYELQLKAKLDSKEIPTWIKYANSAVLYLLYIS